MFLICGWHSWFPRLISGIPNGSNVESLTISVIENKIGANFFFQLQDISVTVMSQFLNFWNLKTFKNLQNLKISKNPKVLKLKTFSKISRPWEMHRLGGAFWKCTASAVLLEICTASAVLSENAPPWRCFLSSAVLVEKCTASAVLFEKMHRLGGAFWENARPRRCFLRKSTAEAVLFDKSTAESGTKVELSQRQ